MKISLALAVVLLAATPSLATFLRAAVGFRLGLGPHEFSRSYGWGHGGRGVGGGIGGYKQIAIGGGGKGHGQGNILSHGASLKVAPLLPSLLAAHGHGKGHGIRPLKLFGINFSLGGKGGYLGHGGGVKNNGWGWSGQQNQGGYAAAPVSNYVGVNGGGAYAGSTGAYNTGAGYASGAGWGQGNVQNGGNLVGQYSEQGKAVAYGVKPQAGSPTEYYYPTQQVASSQLKAIEEKPQPQWHNAEKVKILYVPNQQNNEWQQQAQQSQVQPTAQQPLSTNNQQQYQYTASSNNVDSVSAASSQQVAQVVARADGAQPWTPMFTPTMETSASEPVPVETTVVKRQLEDEQQQMQETQENSSQAV